MEIKFEEIVKLARKAALLDAIVGLAKASKYSIPKEDILSIAGEPVTLEKNNEDGDSDV